jgi:hypothetical protein
MIEESGETMERDTEHNEPQRAEEDISNSSGEVSSESSEEVMSGLTEEKISEEIRRDTEMRLLYYSQTGKEGIDERLQELDEEWDIERTFDANAAGVALFGLTFGAIFGRKWFLLPALAAGCLLQRSLKGWSPPMSLFRRLGFRTQSEIECERYALKALRGDFQEIQAPAARETQDFDKVLDAVERS